MLNFDFDTLFDSIEGEEDVTFTRARRAVVRSERLDLEVEREVGLFDRLAGPVTVTYARA